MLEIKLNLSLLKYCKLANTTTVLQEIIEINLRCKKLGFPYFQAKYVLLNNPYVKAFLLKACSFSFVRFNFKVFIKSLFTLHSPKLSIRGPRPENTFIQGYTLELLVAQFTLPL